MVSNSWRMNMKTTDTATIGNMIRFCKQFRALHDEKQLSISEQELDRFISTLERLRRIVK